MLLAFTTAQAVLPLPRPEASPQNGACTNKKILFYYVKQDFLSI
jgi:hypothetical protein